MNIKISEEEAKCLFQSEIYRTKIGSHLYDVNDKNSDTDYLIIYKNFHKSLDIVYPNIHQFQWDDEENNIDYIFTNEDIFLRNLVSGESTINTDVALFTNYSIPDKLNIFFSYKVIKAYLGLAKRDLKQLFKNKNKKFHILRSLYCAEILMENKIPSLKTIKSFKNETHLNTNSLVERERYLRSKLTNKLNSGEVKHYNFNDILFNADTTTYKLMKKLLESNNITEFKY